MPFTSLSIRPFLGVRGEEILDGGGGGVSLSLPFFLLSSPFPPETTDTPPSLLLVIFSYCLLYWYLISRGLIFMILTLKYEKGH